MYVFATHGMNKDGDQAIVVNAFDKSTTFYKLYNAEGDFRDIAKKFKNSYIIAFYACCREVFDKSRHSGLFEGSYDQAVQHFKEKLEKIQL